MKKNYRTFYLVSLAVLLAASAYPIYMAIKVFALYVSAGYVTSAEYPKYIIPYAPMCIAILLSAALFPLIYRFLKKFALVAGSALGLVTFAGAELFFEQIKVAEAFTMSEYPLESWQYSLCIATPEILQSIGEPIYAQNNPVFKLHFYLIAAIIIIAVTGLIYGFTRMLMEGDTSKRRPLYVQLVCVAVFVGLCVLACFTAFYRNGTLQVGTLSGVLMSLFFIMFGVTAGTYAGTLLYDKRRVLATVLPTILAVLTTVAMYIGELVLTDGKLFRFGYGFFYESLGGLVLAPCDILVILLSGAVTFVTLELLGRGRSAVSKQ